MDAYVRVCVHIHTIIMNSLSKTVAMLLPVFIMQSKVV